MVWANQVGHELHRDFFLMFFLLSYNSSFTKIRNLSTFRFDIIDNRTKVSDSRMGFIENIDNAREILVGNLRYRYDIECKVSSDCQ